MFQSVNMYIHNPVSQRLVQRPCVNRESDACAKKNCIICYYYHELVGTVTEFRGEKYIYPSNFSVYYHVHTINMSKGHVQLLFVPSLSSSLLDIK